MKRRAEARAALCKLLLGNESVTPFFGVPFSHLLEDPLFDHLLDPPPVSVVGQEHLPEELVPQRDLTVRPLEDLDGMRVPECVGPVPGSVRVKNGPERRNPLEPHARDEDVGSHSVTFGMTCSPDTSRYLPERVSTPRTLCLSVLGPRFPRGSTMWRVLSAITTASSPLFSEWRRTTTLSPPINAILTPHFLAILAVQRSRTCFLYTLCKKMSTLFHLHNKNTGGIAKKTASLLYF